MTRSIAWPLCDSWACFWSWPLWYC